LEKDREFVRREGKESSFERQEEKRKGSSILPKRAGKRNWNCCGKRGGGESYRLFLTTKRGERGMAKSHTRNEREICFDAGR